MENRAIMGHVLQWESHYGIAGDCVASLCRSLHPLSAFLSLFYFRVNKFESLRITIVVIVIVMDLIITAIVGLRV